MASGAAGVNFSQLPSELLCSIGDKVDLTVDRVRFRSTCKSWRSSLKPPFPHPPWLFLSDFQDQIQTTDNCDREAAALDVEEDEEEEEEIDQIETEENEGVVNGSIPPCRRPRSFVGVGDQQIYELDLPEAYQTRCVGSTGNWLITIDLLGMIRLLNPFSRVQFHLPPHSAFSGIVRDDDVEWDTIPYLRRDTCLWKAILTSSSPNKKDCIAIAIYLSRLAIARPGDASWIDIDCSIPRSFDDIIIYKDQLYGVNALGTVVVWDNITSAFDDDRLHSPPKASILLNTFQLLNFSSPYSKKYLVEWLGELLLVIKFAKFEYDQDHIPSYNTTSFKFYKLDFANKKRNELSCLGDYSLFLGVNTSISVLASNYSTWVKKNCIYFTDDYTFGYRGNGIKGGHDMGVFDVETNSIQPHYEGKSLSFYSPPLWIVPTARAY